MFIPDRGNYRVQQKNLQKYNIDELISLSDLKADSRSI